MQTNKNNKIANKRDKKITRKQAIKKAGIAALTSASIMFLSSAAGPQASSNSKSVKHRNPGWPK